MSGGAVWLLLAELVLLGAAAFVVLAVRAQNRTLRILTLTVATQNDNIDMLQRQIDALHDQQETP
jgi:hypothetical protein